MFEKYLARYIGGGTLGVTEKKKKKKEDWSWSILVVGLKNAEDAKC